MKKIFKIIALLILILVSLVAIAVSFSDLSKNEEQNKALATQIKQNVELKEKLSKIEYIIEVYGKKTNELNKISERLGIEEARLQDEKTELKKIKEELDKDSADIDSKEKKLNKEILRLKDVGESLTKTKKKLDDDERKWKEKNKLSVKNPTGDQPTGDQSTGDQSTGTSEKEEMPKELKDRKAQFNKDNDKYKNDFEKYEQGKQNLQNSRDEYQTKMDNYNERLRRYNDDCLAFNQEKSSFDAENSEHNGKAYEIKKLKNEKLEIEQKISSFEKENPDIEAKYQELEKTKSYLTMIVAIFSFLVLALVILLIFMLVFRGENKRVKASNEVTKKVEPKLDTHGTDLNTSTGRINKPNETENKLSRNNQNTLIDNISQINANLEKRLNQLKNENAYLKEKLEKLESENAELKETLKKLEENKLYGQTTTQHPKDKNTPPEDALIDEYSDSSEREKYKFEGKIYLNINKDYKQGRMENHDGINSIFSKSEFSTGSLFILIKNKLYFNFYRYNEDKPLPDSENESVIMGEIFDFKKDMYGRIKWCSPAIVEFENGNYVVKHKGSVCIEK